MSYLHITKDNVLLAATTTGLLVGDVSKKNLQKVKWQFHVKDCHRGSSLSNNATMYVTEDKKHHIFVCTESGGVNQILSQNLLAEQLEFKHYNMTEGFPSDVALSAYAVDNYLLVVSNNQLIQLFPDNDDTHQFKTFFLKDRLRFSDAEPTLLPDGRRIFGLQDGAFTIKATDIQKSSFVPPIALTGLSICNQAVQHAINSLDTLVLKPNERAITVYFSALNYSGEGNISYAFLLGKDENQWNYIHQNHSATFLDLRPGTYQLKIRSTNSDGIWVDNIRCLTIIVTPTFWETRWAKALYLLIIALIAWGLIYTRQHISNLKRQQREAHEAYLTLLKNQHFPIEAQVMQSPTEPVVKLKPEDEDFMQRAMKFIELHIGDADINIGDMAEATATSRSGLNRKMKSLLGVTPLDFIREARIQKACQMLKSGASVNDVAHRCGFSDPKYFGKCFKADIGMTPTEYKVENSPK